MSYFEAILIFGQIIYISSNHVVKFSPNQRAQGIDIATFVKYIYKSVVSVVWE